MLPALTLQEPPVPSPRPDIPPVLGSPTLIYVLCLILIAVLFRKDLRILAITVLCSLMGLVIGSILVSFVFGYVVLSVIPCVVFVILVFLKGIQQVLKETTKVQK